LLNRFKDKNPSALNNLDFLLQHTYSQIIEASNIIDELKSQQAQISNSLTNVILSNNILCRVVGKLDDNQANLLMRYITPIIDD
jgi:capsular polysaccharide biosynthesis protein